jgi:hypothetical protein
VGPARGILAKKGSASNTLTAGFRVEASSEALARFSKCGIFNFRSERAIHRRRVDQYAADHGVKLDMDGRGRCHDNIFFERSWWPVKHEWVYLRPAGNGIEQKRSPLRLYISSARIRRSDGQHRTKPISANPWL